VPGRNEYIKSRADDATQQEIADEVGLSQRRVGQVIEENDGIPSITSKPKPKPKRIRVSYTLLTSTKPDTAARKIIDKFGVEFADNLKSYL